MHYEFALESYQRHINNKHSDFSLEVKERQFLNFVITQEELINFADSYKDKKISSICTTVRQILKNGNYRRVTEKQKYALCQFLLDKNNNSAQDILLKIYPQLEGLF